MTPVLLLIVRLTVVLAIGWILVLCVRKSNPRWTVLTTRAMMAATVLVPLIAFAGPVWNLPLLPSLEHDVMPEFDVDVVPAPERTIASHGDRRAVLPALTRSSPSDFDATVVGPENPIQMPVKKLPMETPSQISITQPTRPSITKRTPQTLWRMALGIAWIAGAFLLLARMLFELSRTMRLIAGSTAATTRIQTVMEAVSLRTVGAVRLSDAVRGPCSAGWMKPRILLPTAWAETASEHDLCTVIAHELSHVEGRDSLWDLLARLCQAAWWFHPLVWMLPKRHQLACEHLSDAAAAQVSGGTASYRSRLATWALEFNERSRQPAVSVLSMADQSQLHRRLQWLKSNCDTKRLARGATGAAIIGGLLILFACTSLSFVRAQTKTLTKTPDEAPKTQAPFVEKEPLLLKDDSSEKIFHVRAVDEEDRPVPSAEVHASVSKWDGEEDDRGGFGEINYRPFDDKGEIVLTFPRNALAVNLWVRADGFSLVREHYTLKGTATVKLKRGRIIKVRTVDEAGKLVEDAFPILENSHIRGREFKPDGSGNHVSPAVSMDRRWLRVVGVSDDDVLQFSDLIDVTAKDAADADGIIHAVLKPGITVRGQLDASVPRPVENGIINLCIAEEANHRIPVGFRDVGAQWHDSIPIDRQGLFEIKSLPPGGHLQLYAFTGRHQSRHPSISELRDYLNQHDAGGEDVLEVAKGRQSSILPLLFSLVDDDGDGIVKIKVPCVPTTRLTAKIVSPTGEPLSGATLRFDPNGVFLAGNLFIPGPGYSSSEMVRMTPYHRPQWIEDTFHAVETDENGIAIVDVPGYSRQGFRVEADGFVLPIHPLSPPESQYRYASVELEPGASLRRTITMEREIDLLEREVMILDDDGKPLPEIALTVIDVGFEAAPDDWELWSVQRFGEICRATSSAEGKAILRVPKTINGQGVAQYRVNVEGLVDLDAPDEKRRTKAQVRTRLALPLLDNGNVIAVSVSKNPPKYENNSYRDATAIYVDPATLAPATATALVEELIQRPTLAVLNRLLAINEYTETTPLEFFSDFNYVTNNQSPVASIPVGDETRVIVLCFVRPRGSTWTVKPELGRPPQAAFVFNKKNGKLITTVGGGQSERGSYDSVTLMNFGGSDDYFLQVRRFEQRDVNDMGTRWYRVARVEHGPSLTIQHAPNGNKFWGTAGPADPPGEFGILNYFPEGRSLKDHIPGLTSNGVAVPRQIYWDTGRDRFYGAENQTVSGASIYRVITEQSSEFVPFKPKASDIVVGGGRDFHGRGHMWTIKTPADIPVQLYLRVRETSDEENKTSVLLERTLKPGTLHAVHLAIDPKKRTQELSGHVVATIAGERATDDDWSKFTTAKFQINSGPSVQGQPVLRADDQEVVLLRKTTRDDETSKSLVLELVVRRHNE